MQDTLSIFDTLLVKPSDGLEITHALNDSLLKVLRDFACGSNLMDYLVPIAGAFIGAVALIYSTKITLERSTKNFIRENRVNQATVLTDNIRSTAADYAAAVTDFYHTYSNNLLTVWNAGMRVDDFMKGMAETPESANKLNELHDEHERIYLETAKQSEVMLARINVTMIRMRLLLDDRYVVTKKVIDIMNSITGSVGKIKSIKSVYSDFRTQEALEDASAKYRSLHPEIFGLLEIFQNEIKIYIENKIEESRAIT